MLTAEKELHELRPKLQAAFDFAQKQVVNLIQTYPDYFPVYTEQGKWRHTGEAWTNWCEGFLGDVDESVMWGDYFFVEALAKALVLEEA